MSNYAPYDWYFGGDLSSYTGYTPPAASLPDSQVTILDNGPAGVTAFQAHGDVGGIILDTLSGLGTSDAPPAGTNWHPTVTAEYSFDDITKVVAPWASGDPNAGVVFSVSVQIPYENSTNWQLDPAGNQSIAFAPLDMIMKDESTGLEFYYGAEIYNPRGVGAIENDQILTDGVVGIVGTAALQPGQITPQGNEYGTAVWDSEGAQGETWTGYKTISYAITGNNLLAAIAGLQATFPSQYGGLSTNIANYHVISAYYSEEAHLIVNNTEIWENGSSGRIGGSFRHLTLKTSASLALPFFRLFSPSINRHFYTVSTAQVANAESLGYNLEGNAGQLYAEAPSGTDLIPLYRFFRSSDGDHCYTTAVTGDPTCGTAYGYVQEPTAGYLPNQTGCSVSLYRVYSSSGGHFYTISKAEAESVPNSTLEDTYCIKP